MFFFGGGGVPFLEDEAFLLGWMNLLILVVVVVVLVVVDCMDSNDRVLGADLTTCTTFPSRENIILEFELL